MYSKEASGDVTQREHDASDGGARILKGSVIASTVKGEQNQGKNPSIKVKAKPEITKETLMESQRQLQTEEAQVK